MRCFVMLNDLQNINKSYQVVLHICKKLREANYTIGWNFIIDNLKNYLSELSSQNHHQLVASICASLIPLHTNTFQRAPLFERRALSLLAEAKQDPSRLNEARECLEKQFEETSAHYLELKDYNNHGEIHAYQLTAIKLLSEFKENDNKHRNYLNTIYSVLNFIPLNRLPIETANEIYKRFLMLGSLLCTNDRANQKIIHYFNQTCKNVLRDEVWYRLNNEMKNDFEILATELDTAESQCLTLQQYAIMSDDLIPSILRKCDADQKRIKFLENKCEVLIKSHADSESRNQLLIKQLQAFNPNAGNANGVQAMETADSKPKTNEVALAVPTLQIPELKQESSQPPAPATESDNRKRVLEEINPDPTVEPAAKKQKTAGLFQPAAAAQPNESNSSIAAGPR